MPTAATFGANLRRARLKAHLTQEELAHRLGFKRTTPISIWERGSHIPNPKTIVKLATAIGCPTATLLRRVITPYDELRGSTRIVRHRKGTPPSEESLTDQEVTLLSLARKLPRQIVASHIQLMESEVRLRLPRHGQDGVLGAGDARFRARGPAPRPSPRADTA